jgi:hypothetical protein
LQLKNGLVAKMSPFTNNLWKLLKRNSAAARAVSDKLQQARARPATSWCPATSWALTLTPGDCSNFDMHWFWVIKTINNRTFPDVVLSIFFVELQQT